MPSERDCAIMRHYPDLFGSPPWDMRETCMAFGFDIGEGWRPIVLDLLEELQGILREEGLTSFRITQVKQKFASLRVYAGGGIERTDAAIDAAEERSRITCEVCGRSGTLRQTG